MSADLNVARDLAQQYPDRYKLVDKLKDRFDDRVGAVLWALHRDGLIDVSDDYGWWSDMVDAEGSYSAADVAGLLRRASRTPNMAGMISTYSRKKQLGFNIYTRMMVEQTVAEPAPLVEAFREVPEPMRSAFGLELIQHGVIGPDDMPDGALELLAGAAVTEVGHQALVGKMAKAWDADVLGPALNAAAAAEGVELWSLDFLEVSEPYLTPELLARIALNIDYRDTVVEMISVLDRNPEGLEDAILDAIAAEVPGADFGVRTALGWVAARHGARGEFLDEALGARLLEAMGGEQTKDHALPMLAGVVLSQREPWVVERLGSSYSPDFAALKTTITDRTAKAAIRQVQDWGRGGRHDDDSIVAGLRAVGRHRPDWLAAVYLAKKVPHRRFLVEGLVGAEPSEKALQALVAAMSDNIDEVRDAAVRALQSMGEAAEPVVFEALTSRKKVLRRGAAEVMAGWPHERVHEAAVAAHGTEKVDDIAELLAPLARDPEAAPLPPSAEERVAALREALTDGQKEAYDQAWSGVRWGRHDAGEAGRKLVQDHGEGALVVAYDGLFRKGGSTTDKLALWRQVVDAAPVDAFVAELYVRMLAGWPAEGEGFDKTVQAHRAAVQRGWAHLGARFGDEARVGAERVLREADASGHDAVWAFWLEQGFGGAVELFTELAPRSGPGFAELGLRALGVFALPPILSELSARKADARQQAAEVLEAVPVAEALPVLEARLDKERSERVQRALARAAFACAAVDATPLAEVAEVGPHVLDARLAKYPGPLPKPLGEVVELRWADDGALSDRAATFVWSRLGEEGRDHHDPVLDVVAAHLDRAHADGVWQQLQLDHADHKEARTGWILFAGAVLGDDASMAALGRDLDEEARYGSSSVAFYKLEILARHGSAPALTWVDHWSRKARSQGLQQRAEEALDAMAEARGVTRDEIADRVAGRLGFDAHGAQPFPYGSRTLTLRLTADGALRVIRDDGRALKSLPKALADDDAETIAARRKEFSALKKAVKQVVQAAGERLEQAMVTGRRIGREALAESWAGNPLLRVLGERVVWAAWEGEERVALAHLGEGDRLITLEGGTVPWTDATTVSVAHPLELTEAEQAGWQVWADAGTPPPFPQLGRPTFSLTTEEAELKHIERFEHASIATGRLRGTLERRGWTRGAPQDAGAVMWFVKWFPRADVTAILRLDPGFGIGGWDAGPSAQGIPKIELVHGRRGREPGWHLEHVPVGQADPIVVSEILGDVAAAR